MATVSRKALLSYINTHSAAQSFDLKELARDLKREEAATFVAEAIRKTIQLQNLANPVHSVLEPIEYQGNAPVLNFGRDFGHGEGLLKFLIDPQGIKSAVITNERSYRHLEKLAASLAISLCDVADFFVIDHLGSPFPKDCDIVIAYGLAGSHEYKNRYTCVAKVLNSFQQEGKEFLILGPSAADFF